jgi:hypothetical protein
VAEFLHADRELRDIRPRDLRPDGDFGWTLGVLQRAKSS